MRAYAVRRASMAAVLTVLAALWTGLGQVPAAASCAGRTPVQVVGDSDVVLAGRLAQVDDPGGNASPHDLAWTVEVTAVHKGEAPTTAHVLATQYSHDEVVAGRTYVFALDVTNGVLRAGGCQDIAPAGTADANGLVGAAGPGRVPTAGGTALPGAADIDLGGGMSATTMLLIGLAGLLVVTVGGLALAVGLGLLAGRRRSRSGADGEHGSGDGTRPDPTEKQFK